MAEAESKEEMKLNAPFCSDEDVSLLELGSESDVMMFWLYEVAALLLLPRTVRGWWLWWSRFLDCSVRWVRGLPLFILNVVLILFENLKFFRSPHENLVQTLRT